MTEKFDPAAFSAQLLAEAEKLADDMQSWRREFHQFPEVAFEENITASRIKCILDSIPGVEVVTGFGIPTSVIGVIRSDLEGPALVIRACMDAIEVEEATGASFASCMPGVMHASGHDAYMASLLGTAALLAAHSNQLTQRIVLLFQPAGEGRGGAKSLVEANFLETFHVSNCLALNWWPELPYGELFLKKGVITALSDRIHIDVRGVSGHAAEPHMTVDPVTIAAHLIVAIQTMLSREVDPRETALVSFGQVESGFVYNVIWLSL